MATNVRHAHRIHHGIDPVVDPVVVVSSRRATDSATDPGPAAATDPATATGPATAAGPATDPATATGPATDPATATATVTAMEPDREAPLAGRMSRAARTAAVAAAAVGVIAVTAVAWAVIPGTPPASGTLPVTVADADFAFRASDVCARLDARMATFGFRSDAEVSELADARSRMDALGQAAGSLRAIGVPVSSPAVAEWVAGQLDLARLQSAAVLSAPSADVAHYRWIAVDPAIERAVAPLASIGAARCGL